MNATLALKGVTVRAGRRALLDDVSLSLAPGEFVVLVGPNGAGKTTLLRTALGVERPTAGNAYVRGQVVHRLPSHLRAAAVAWLPQDPLHADALTALDVTTAARYRFQESVRQSRAAAQQALAQVGAVEYAGRPLQALSGGERQRVALAVALAQEAPLLLLDEPANHLDPGQQLALYQLIGTLWRQGRGILCVTHDVNLVHFAARGRDADVTVIGIRDGRIRFRHSLGAAGLVEDLSELFGVAFATTRIGATRLILLAEEPLP